MIVLSVYTGTVYKEFKLPVINDSDYSIFLHKNIFALNNDVELMLEVINNVWSIKGSRKYRIIKEEYHYDRLELCDNDVFQIYTEDRESVTVVIRNVTYAVAVFDKYDISNQQQITIGKKQEMDICYDFLGIVSREHAVLSKEQAGWKIYNKSPNGVYINSEFITQEKVLEFGDHISIMGLNLVFLGDVLAIDNSQNNVIINTGKLSLYIASYAQENETSDMVVDDGRILLHRAPRNIIKIDKTPVNIAPAPPKNEVKKESIMQTVASTIAMAIPMLLCGILMIYSSKQNGGGRGAFMYMGIIMAISSTVIGVITAIVSMNSQGKQVKRDELHRFDAYSKYLIEITNKIREKYNNNMSALHNMYKSAEECTLYDVESGLLWNRNEHHEDFLFFRLGLGDMPFQAEINIENEKNILGYVDSLANKPSIIRDNFDTLYNVPIGVNLLKHRIVGMVGGQDYSGAVHLVKLLMAQIGANTCYTDVKLVFVYNKNSFYNTDEWDFVKWFPHTWSEDKKVRYIASNKQEASDIFYELAKVFRQRDEEGTDNEIPTPHYIMVLMNPELLDGELISRYVYNPEPRYGLSTVIVADSYVNIPNACEYIIENDNIFQGKYNVSQEEEDQVHINFDSISDGVLEKFARKLSNIRVNEVEIGGDIPQSLTFFDMYGVKKLSELDVLNRWRKNRTYENIKGLLGEKAGGVLSYLDVHEKYHGPHGLVAGTTGSGKSETLQTYMLSLAVNYSPDDIGFFIIDYKGGGMANLFDGLPHLIGQISNLSGNQVKRAMVSIKSENRRRQKVFNENGVNNINAYTKLYKNNEATLPVPHLFIIIDEFAELKREEPEFMQELISVAQVGRSLGVHLILATQKPSGTVNDNIWSNTKFRLCLRVADKQDSNDMLHKPDAAYITQAGRCYLQVGSDEVFELFQSGYSGATYIEDDSVSTEIANMVSLTGRVDMVGSYAKSAHKDKTLYVWYKNIAGIVATAMNQLETNINYCVENRYAMMQVINQVYRIMEDSNIDYTESVYNTARLEDFINTYYSVMTLDGDVISNLMAVAAQNKLVLPQKKEKSQLDAVKDYLAVIAKENGYDYELKLWMPVLPTQLYLNSIPEFCENCYSNGSWADYQGVWSLNIVVGMLDDPQNQQQIPLYLDFAENGHYSVCGLVSSGRSTSLQTIAYSLICKYSPDYVNIYAIDFSSRLMASFEHAPHVGGVMCEGEHEKIAKFFNMLRGMLAERKKLFKGGNYSQYVRANGITVPAAFVFIDNVGAFNEKTDEKYLEDLITLSKEGVSQGIYLVLSGGGFGSRDIPTRVAENIKTSITTEMVDKYSYSEIIHVSGFDVLPESGIKGRGLAAYGGRALEYQTALAVEAEDDYSRSEFIEAVCMDMSQNWTGRKARQIPVIPEKPVWSEFSALEEFEAAIQDRDLLPVAYNAESAAVYSIDLRDVFCYLITGHGRSGKKNYLRTIIQSAMLKDSHICVIDGPSGSMKAYSDEENINYITNEEELFNYFAGIIPEFKKRSTLKKELLAQDVEEHEIYERLSSEQPIFIFVSDYVWFAKTVYESKLDMKGFVENFIEKGRMHNIYFFVSVALDQMPEVDYYKITRLISSYKTGVHFGGDVSSNRVFNFSQIPYKDQSKTYKAGIGLVASNMKTDIDKIVVPLARR